jgi:hypothetical protein
MIYFLSIWPYVKITRNLKFIVKHDLFMNNLVNNMGSGEPLVLLAIVLSVFQITVSDGPFIVTITVKLFW